MTLPPSYELFVGIDIAAATFVVTWTSGGEPSACPLTLGQTPEGFAALQQHL